LTFIGFIGYIAIMPNPKPHIIKPHQRGHRKPLSSEEPTKKFTVCIPESVYVWCKKIGSKALRDILIKAKDESTN
jgi:hypothetical protein